MGDVAPGRPIPPIAFGGDPAAVTARITAGFVDVDDALLARLRGVCADVTVDATTLGETSRDWWPLAMVWALANQVPGLAAAVARPATVEEVAGILRVCDAARVPVTAAAGRSGVCGGSVPVHGGVVLDLCGLRGIVDVDETSLVLDVLAGTFGTPLEDALRRDHAATIGHWPQSMDLSTVGGWLACRGAGQYSTRYGKIEDMVVGLDVVLADGRVVHTGGAPRAAVGPDLDQLFVGSEGTLGIITGARLRLHPAPTAERRAAFGFPSFAEGLDACRRILQRGATPAVLRLYDTVEGQRNFEVADHHLLLVLDEGDPVIVDAVMEVVSAECAVADAARRRARRALGREPQRRLRAAGAHLARLRRRHDGDRGPVARPAGHLRAPRSPPSAGSRARWRSRRTSRTRTPTARASTSPSAARRRPTAATTTTAPRGTRARGAVLAGGGVLSHHHGVGLNRARFAREALGEAFGVLAAAKAALDPHGILNPGKLGLDSPFGPSPAWP